MENNNMENNYSNFFENKKVMSELELEWLVFCLCRDVNYSLSVARLMRLPSEEMSVKC